MTVYNPLRTFPVKVNNLVRPYLIYLPGKLVYQDEVAVFDSSFNQMFPMARSIKVQVKPSTRLMDHTVEDGSTITDHRVILPTEIELSVICSGSTFRDVYQQVKSAYLSGDVFIVTTKADVYVNMMIQAPPHEETPDIYDGIPVSIKMREILLVKTQYQALPEQSVVDENDQSTVDVGTTTGTEVSAAGDTAKSIVASLVDTIQGYLE